MNSGKTVVYWVIYLSAHFQESDLAMSVKDLENQGPAARTQNLLLTNRNFALLWCGQAISILGDVIFSTALVLWIATQIAKGQVWAPLAVSCAFLATNVPTLLIGPFAGVFVDRWNKLRIMLAADLIRAVSMLLLMGITLAISVIGREANIGLLLAVYLVTFLLSTMDRFFRPAMLTLIGDIVEEGKREQAMGLGQFSVSLATIVGPLLATFLFFSIDIHWLLLINMASFVVSFFSLRLIQLPQKISGSQTRQVQSFLKELRAGLFYTCKHSILVTLMISTMIAMLGASALNTLNIFFLAQNLHASQSLYGVMDTVLGLGTVFGAVLSAIFAARIGKLRLIWSSLILIGVLIMAYSRMTSFFPAMILLFLVGCPVAALLVVTGPLILQIVAREFIGRVSSYFDPVTTLASIIGTFLAGFFASTLLYHFRIMFLGLSLSSTDTIILAAGVLILVSGFYAWMRFKGVKLETPESADR